MHRSRPGFSNAITITIAIIIGGALVWLLAWSRILAERDAERKQQIDGLVAQYTQLYEEAQAKGVEPTAPAPEKVEEDSALIVGPTGERGPRGPAGEPGADSTVPGPMGPKGDTGIGLVGPQGEIGITGLTGDPGESIVGPEGPAGPSGESIVGPQGPAGADGQPPLSWTFTVNGRDFACARTDPFDPVAPTYTCTNTTPDVTDQ